MKCAISKKVVFTILLTASFVSGCASLTGAESKKNLQQLKYGMSESKVLNLLGSPDSVIHDTDQDDRWVYEFKREDKRGHNIYVQFKDGSLVRTGELDGRAIAAASENRTPGTCTHRVHPEMLEQSLCIK